MGKTNFSNYFLGVDIGTNSIGYAATDFNYNLCKYQQHPVWGVHLFDSALTSADRRVFRTARRRLDRRQQRIKLLQELFAVEIGKIDPEFFHRIESSSLLPEEKSKKYLFFADENYTDVQYHKDYPTIHHLICELIKNPAPHDIRLVYIACAWLLAHRGHFLSEINKENIDKITDFETVFNELKTFFDDLNCDFPWQETDVQKFGEILKSNASQRDREKALAELPCNAGNTDNPFPCKTAPFFKLICGGKVKLSALFDKDEYEDFSLELGAEDETIMETLSQLEEDDKELLLICKKIYDWAILNKIMQGSTYISEAKVKIYEKHHKDLQRLKYFVKKYLPEKYEEIFRLDDGKTPNYTAYSRNTNESKPADYEKRKTPNIDDFSTYIKSAFGRITPEAEDAEEWQKILGELENKQFLPKQVDSDNRTIPYQIYWNELKNLLVNASKYLPFLLQKDEDGWSVLEKILSIMEFRIPYFVGPLNAYHKQFAWLKRKAEGRILPWNFDKKVDIDACEQEFINRMVNHCTYLPGELVLAKESLLYEQFEVLNFINNICVYGEKISVELKQEIYKQLFMIKRRVTKKMVADLLKSNIDNHVTANDISGIDNNITADLSSYQFFESFFDNKKLTESEVETIIRQRTYTEDKMRFRKYLDKNFAKLTEEEKRTIAGHRFTDFGRLSEKLLTGLTSTDPEDGKEKNIITFMWEKNVNLQTLLGGEYTFAAQIDEIRKEYYKNNHQSLAKRLDDMYVSNSVKRPIIRALTVIKEVVAAAGCAPKKIFVEMARENDPSAKNKRTESRYKTLYELYKQIRDCDIKQVAEELDRYANDESRLQSRALFLYFMQLGRDMYTGEPIEIGKALNKDLYDIEHIYPRSKVKDDSLQNNLVLINKQVNGDKSDSYPISADIQNKMRPFWEKLQKNGLITEEKFRRLTRNTPFSAEEKWGFINRQLVETRQSTKVVAELLKEFYPDTEIVYSKASLASEFRQEYGMLKSRTLNDLHHAKDAYLNVVVGNVYHEKFTKSWFDNHSDNYSINIDTLFEKSQKVNDKVIWEGESGIGKVRKIMERNYIHLTNYAYCQKGGLFDQMPLRAKDTLIPLKKDKDVTKYGGYNKSTATFFVFVQTINGKNGAKNLILVPIDLMISQKFLADENYAKQHICETLGQPAENICFPLDLKPIRVKSVFEVDDCFRFRLNSKSGGGKQIVVSPFSPLFLSPAQELLVKRMESFCEKAKNGRKIIFNEKCDKFNEKQMQDLFDTLIEKMQQKPFCKRPGNFVNILINGKEKFQNLQFTKERNDDETNCIINQAKMLLDIISALGSGGIGGTNLSNIGGQSKNGVPFLSTSLVNWKNNYHDVRLINSNASGLHEIRSENLLDYVVTPEKKTATKTAKKSKNAELEQGNLPGMI